MIYAALHPDDVETLMIAGAPVDFHAGEPQIHDWMQVLSPLGGMGFYLWIVERLFMNNELVKGELEIGGARVDLGRIACPLILLAGAEDHITPAPQVFALADFAATPESEVTRLTAPGGHLGLFMGRAALDDYWRPLFEDLARRGTSDLPD